MSVCISMRCKKFNQCARAAINNPGVHTATNKAEMAFVRADSSGLYVEEYWCGEKGNYRLFEELKDDKTVADKRN